jgi:PIN domain nuclease of toxin-antitoxin system
MKAVLDASAVLAILNFEPGAEKARSYLPDGWISAANAAEVGAKLSDKGMPVAAAQSALALLRLKVADFDAALAHASVELRQPTRAKGLSLADRACLSLAIREQATAVTADRVWADIDLPCKVELIR